MTKIRKSHFEFIEMACFYKTFMILSFRFYYLFFYIWNFGRCTNIKKVLWASSFLKNLLFFNVQNKFKLFKHISLEKLLKCLCLSFYLLLIIFSTVFIVLLKMFIIIKLYKIYIFLLNPLTDRGKIFSFSPILSIR